MAHQAAPKWTKLSPEFWNEKWLDAPEVILSRGANLTNLEDIKRFIVNLNFKKGGDKSATGTGFFINLHDWDTPNFPRIILTAAHNLIEAGTKKLSTDITAEFIADRRVSDVAQPINEENKKMVNEMTKIAVNEDMIFINERYKENPGPDSTRHDWGFIILERQNDPRGFGINLLLGQSDRTTGGDGLLRRILQDNDVHIMGHGGGGSSLKFTHGRGTISSTEEITYEAGTEPGLSGSPVWVSYQGNATVIAIHAYGPDEKRKKSMGSRIDFELLREVYKQEKLGYMSRTLKAFRKKVTKDDKPFEEGVYLHFPSVKSRAKVHYGAVDLQTTFDILPALTPPSYVEQVVQYVFRFHVPEDKPGTEETSSWVLWNVEMNRVTITDHLHPACLVTLVKGQNYKDNGSLQLQFPEPISKKVKTYNILKLGATRLRIEDQKEFGIPAISSEVRIVQTKYHHDNPDRGEAIKGVHFNHFLLEEAKD